MSGNIHRGEAGFLVKSQIENLGNFLLCLPLFTCCVRYKVYTQVIWLQVAVHRAGTGQRGVKNELTHHKQIDKIHYVDINLV